MSHGTTHIVTGGAGFIAVTLVKRLLERDGRVVLIDNLSRGRREFFDAMTSSNRLAFHQADVADAGALADALDTVREGDVEVWHLCANSDIPAGVNDPNVDLKDTFLVTHALLGQMRQRGWTRINFASTSAVYGDHGQRRLDEETYCQPISNYGAMKLASEAAIGAASELFLDHATIFRFPNVVGIPATHGVILDFLHKLRRTPERLEVLGNGTQRKAYLHVSDLVDAMLWIRDNGPGGISVHNIGPDDDGITVREIAELVRDAVAPGAKIEFGTEDRGWVGDVPRFRYDVSRLAKLGWSPTMTSHEAITRAVNEIARQEGFSIHSGH